MILFICSLFTVAVVYYVFFYPGELYAGEEKTRLIYLHERKEAVYENLRDLNFEYKAGKVPDVDYQSLRASLEDEAATIMAEIARIAQAQSAVGNA
jgi:outer membrane protein TolC